MATTGTHGFNPALVEMIDEGFERCGVSSSDLRGDHVRSAIRSANLMSTDWQNFGYNEWQLYNIPNASVSAGTSAFSGPNGAYDIFHASIADNANLESVREIYPISRSDYNALANRLATGTPDRYFVDRSQFIHAGTVNPRALIYLYQVPNKTYYMNIWYIRKQMDVGDPQNTLDMSPGFYEAFASGMAYFLSVKFAPDRSDKLGIAYYGERFYKTGEGTPGGALGRALIQNRETSDAVFRVDFSRHRGRR